MQNPEELKEQLPAPAPEEFEDLVINPVLPKKKKVLKVQKPHKLTAIFSDIINSTQKLFLKRPTSTLVGEEYYSNPVFIEYLQGLIDILNSLYIILVRYKASLHYENGMPIEMPLVFENDIFAKLDSLTVGVSRNFNLLCSLNDQLYSELIKVQLKLHLFCHNHTCYIKGEELAHDNRIVSVIDCYFGWASMLLHTGQLVNAEYYLLKEKKLIDVFKVDKISTMWLFLANNYSYMATVYYRKGDYINAKEYALKANRFSSRMSEQGITFDINAYKIYMEFMQLAYKLSRFDEALFWAKIALSHCKNVILFIQRTSESIKDTTKKEFEDKVKSIKSLIHVYKNKLIQQKHEALKLILSDYPLTLNNIQSNPLFSSKPNQITSINVHKDNELFYLLNLLRRLSIVCQYDASSTSITIFNLMDVNVKSIKNALDNWANFIATKSLKQEIIIDDDVLSPPILIPSITVSVDAPEDQVKSNDIQNSQKSADTRKDNSLIDQANLTLENDTQRVPVIKRKNMPINNSEASASDQKTTKHNKVINWGENYPSYFRSSHNVFKLRGDLKRHYLTIKPEFLGEISQQNPMAAKNLLQICERGKQLGDSRGDKGVLVTGDKAKAKDSSKPYRFFGRVVATMKDEKQKIRTLIEFNGWTENHKQKAPTEILPPACNKNIRPKNQ